jgi:hypothetical protein
MLYVPARGTRHALERLRFGQPAQVHRGIAIHFPGLQGLDKPIVWVFPKLLVCLNCGAAQFAIPESELSVLVEDRSRRAAG